MTDQELAEAIAKLREFTFRHGMQWVLDEVDEAIALGVPETRTLRQTHRAGRTEYEDVTEPDIPVLTTGLGQRRRSRRSEEIGRGRQDFVRSRPMSTREQALLIVQALGRVLTDLDTIADGILGALDPGSLSDYLDVATKPVFEGYSSPSVGTIRFEPDEGSAAPAVSIDVIRGSDRGTRVDDILRQIRVEIEE